MKINVISRTIAVLFVVYGACSAGSLINAAGNITNSAVRSAQRVQNRLTGTGTMQQRDRIVQAPANERDMSGETMYAQPYEEETQEIKAGNRGIIGKPVYTILPVDEPIDTRRPGMMYAS